MIRLDRPPAPRHHGVVLDQGDVVTARHRFIGPVTATVRTWGDGWIAGPDTRRPARLRTIAAADILVVERAGVRL